MSCLRSLWVFGAIMVVGAGCGAISGEQLSGTGGHGAGGSAATGGSGAATGGSGAGGGPGCGCSPVSAPVCGVDGVTYLNECFATCFAGVGIAYQGGCATGGVDGGFGCNVDSDCVLASSSCCGLLCAPPTAVPASQSTVVCNISCPIRTAPSCGCMNHQCVLGSGPSGQDGGGDSLDAGGASCGDLANEYATVLSKGEACDVGASGQCQQAVSSFLSPCGSCATYVNDATALDAIEAAWMGEGCNDVAVACPAVVCQQPGAGACVAADGGGGRCQAVSVALPL